ncbi:MAG: hypothetical protein J7497_17835, partial [Chitinophagaceae bacterium]|nr:hypothetical protein [Chitinophagaceae bacterium]
GVRFPLITRILSLLLVKMFLLYAQVVIGCADFADQPLIASSHLRNPRIRIGEFSFIMALQW